MGRNVSGLVRAPAGTPVGGIGTEILDADGLRAASVRTFRHGEFYIPRLRPGTWRARVAAASPGATADGVTFTVPVSGYAPIRLEGLELRR